MSVSVSASRRVYRAEAGAIVPQWDEVATEVPLTLDINGEEWATLVCSPDCLKELVLGFLISEGIICSEEAIDECSFDLERGVCYIQTKEPLRLRAEMLTKRSFTSCCGKGRPSFYFLNDIRTVKVVHEAPSLSLAQAFALVGQLQERSHLFFHTGGVHNAALCSADEVIAVRCDIGRHNALDKLYGYCVQRRISTADKVIAFSGRISSEILVKVAKIGIGLVLSKSAPTELALQMAEELGITVLGFVRGDSLNIYTHPERVVEWQEPLSG